MTQTQTVDTLERLRADYAFMASNDSGGLRHTEIGWQWKTQGTTYYMLGQEQVQQLGADQAQRLGQKKIEQLGDAALGEAAGIVEAVKEEDGDTSAEVYVLDPNGVLRVVGLSTLAAEAPHDVNALAESLDGTKPAIATAAQKARFWVAVTQPLA